MTDPCRAFLLESLKSLWDDLVILSRTFLSLNIIVTFVPMCENTA